MKDVRVRHITNNYYWIKKENRKVYKHRYTLLYMDKAINPSKTYEFPMGVKVRVWFNNQGVREGENIVSVRDYEDINDLGEVCHILAELEITKQDLLGIFDEMR